MPRGTVARGGNESMTADNTPILPGRLGSPGMMLKDDPRADPRMLAAMAPIGLGEHPAAAPVTVESSIEELLEYCGMAEAGFEMLFAAMSADSPATSGVTSTVEVIRGIDGNDVTLFIHRPTDVSGPIPALLHLH